MRHRRAAKFAEYISTYAILNAIGLHNTVVVEKRDPSVGLGVYVRDACDEGTTLMVVPSKRVCSRSVLDKIGLQASWSVADEAAMKHLDDGIITQLSMSNTAEEWMRWSWRLGLEDHRSYSHLWGWLRALPGPEDLREQHTAAERTCRIHHVAAYPYFLKAERQVAEEIRTAEALMSANNLMPSPTSFAWAVRVLLSRGMLLPSCWPEKREVAPPTELGVVPYVDLINGPDGAGRRANAEVEVATTVEELPTWYVEWIQEEHRNKGPLHSVEAIMAEHYAVCVSLQRPLRANEEVILDYPIPTITTGVLGDAKDAQLSRLLKYLY